MTWWDAAFLAAAGVVGGLTGSIAGLASIATYPALLVVGLPPVTANVTNTVAMVFNGIGSILGSRPELEGLGPWLKRIVPVAAVGGAPVRCCCCPRRPRVSRRSCRSCSACLRRHSRAIAPHGRQRRRGVSPPTTHRHHSARVRGDLLDLYLRRLLRRGSGGVLLLALLLRAGSATLAHANAGKNVIAGVANSVAALIFAFAAPVHWPAVIRARHRLSGRVAVGTRWSYVTRPQGR